MSKNKIMVKNVYGVQSFADAAEQFRSFGDAGVILANNLEHVSTEIFEQKFPGLTFLNGGIAINNEGGYADAITKLKTSVNGAFRLSGSNTNTKGKISVGGEADTIPVFTLEGESDWSKIEIEKAKLQNINLPSKYMSGHNELYQRQLDAIGYIGQTKEDGTAYTEGLLNWSGFTSGAAAGAITALTAQQMYDEFAELIIDQWNGVFNVPEYMADRVVMPDSVYNVISREMLNTAAGSDTVLMALKKNFSTVEFTSTTKARDVGGSSSTVAYSTNRNSMQMRIPVPLNISSVDNRGHKYYMESYFAVAGLDVLEDSAGRILTGL